MPFVSAHDPRVPSVQTPKFGFDGSTPYDGEQVFPNFNSPVPVASYVDSRLILAEAQLAANDATWLTTLNALRTGPTNIGSITVSGMAPLADPGTPGARIDLLFRERARSGRSGADSDSVICAVRSPVSMERRPRRYFPGEGGINPRKNANYGSDVNLPVPQAEAEQLQVRRLYGSGRRKPVRAE